MRSINPVVHIFECDCKELYTCKQADVSGLSRLTREMGCQMSQNTHIRRHTHTHRHSQTEIMCAGNISYSMHRQHNTKSQSVSITTASYKQIDYKMCTCSILYMYKIYRAHANMYVNVLYILELKKRYRHAYVVYMPMHYLLVCRTSRYNQKYIWECMCVLPLHYVCIAYIISEK